jgi:hypothetical protein
MGIETPKQARNDFEKQFSSPKRLNAFGADINVLRLDPKNPKSEIPIFLAEAFVHGKEAYKHSIEAICKRGRSVIIYDQPREGGELILSDEVRASIKEYLETCPEEVRAALILLESLRQQKISRIDVLAHSRGFAYAAIAALIDDKKAEIEARINFTKKRPNIIRGIVAYGPSGLIGEDSMPAIVGRTLMQNFTHPEWPKLSEEIFEEINTDEMKRRRSEAEAKGMFVYGEPTEEGKKIAQESGRELLKSQVSLVGGSLTRSYAEARGLTSLQLQNAVKKLRSLGIQISTMRGNKDTVFPTERSQENIRELRNYGVSDITIEGEHSSLVFDPRIAEVAENEFMLQEDRRKASSESLVERLDAIPKQ